MPEPATHSAQPTAQVFARRASLGVGGGLVRPLALLLAALALVPMVFVAWVTLHTPWATIIALVFRPRVAELLLNTLMLVLLTLPLCAALGLATAWLVERTALPGRRLWAALAVAPLAIPAFVHSYAWVSVAPAIHGLGAAVLISVLAYSPFFYLPLAATLRRLDPALDEVAGSLGLRPWQVGWRVVLPQLRLPLCGGALLVGLHLLAEYGLFALVRFDTFTTAIYDQFQSSFNGPAANMLAAVLALACLLLVWLESWLRGGARYARVGTGSARECRPRALRPWTCALALLGLGGVALLAVGVPMLTLARWLVAGGSAVWAPEAIVPALLQTLLLGIGGALLISFAAVPAAWLSIRVAGRHNRWIEACYYLGSALPGIVVALALVSLTVQWLRPLYQTLFTLLLAYLLLFVPRALVSLRTAIAQAPVELENIARSLGRSPRQALWATTLRLAAPGFAAGFALVFLAIINELTATLLLAPNGTRTLAMVFWIRSSEIDYAQAAPYALIMVLMSLPLTWVLYEQSKRVAGR